MEPLELSLAQQFEVNRFSRVIDETTDVPTLQRIAKELLQAWQSQKAVTTWVMKENLQNPPSFKFNPDDFTSNQQQDD